MLLTVPIVLPLNLFVHFKDSDLIVTYTLFIPRAHVAKHV